MSLDLEARDTIAALLTGTSDGVLAVVRISGPDAEGVRDRCFERRRAGAWTPAKLVLGSIRSDDGTAGEALCVTFPGTRSYTGEPCVEIHGFGGRINAQRLLGTVLKGGARQAAPGEFTLRAYLHGKLSLDQAEAVGALLMAQSEEAARQAELSRRGGLASALEPVREGVLSLLAETEAYLDFPDDGLPHQRMDAQRVMVGELVESIGKMLRGHARSRRLLEGARVVLWGAPNAGKSTLLNALCGESRSIVDEAPGTTRDVVETRVVWEGMPVLLLDTAGVREAPGRVEQEGVRRSQLEASRADVVLYCVPADAHLRELSDPPATELPIVVETKGDLASSHGVALSAGRRLGTEPVTVSALAGRGVDELRRVIVERLTGKHAGGEGGVVAATTRQGQLLEEARHALRQAIVAREEREPEEVVAQWFRRAATAVGEVSGRAMPPEEVLGAIFSRFCIGK